MQSYGAAYLLDSFNYLGPPPDPLEIRIEAALDQGADITGLLEILDADDDDRETEETDGGSTYPEDVGLAVNETVRLSRECLCCGDIHQCEEIFIS